MEKRKGRNGGTLYVPQKGDPSPNPFGRPPGPNRRTIVRKVFAMSGVIPDEVFGELKKIYPTLERNMTIEEVMTICQVAKAIVSQDTYAYNSLMTQAYGAPKAEEPEEETDGPTGQAVPLGKLLQSPRLEPSKYEDAVIIEDLKPAEREDPEEERPAAREEKKPRRKKSTTRRRT